MNCFLSAAIWDHLIAVYVLRFFTLNLPINLDRAFACPMSFPLSFYIFPAPLLSVDCSSQT